MVNQPILIYSDGSSLRNPGSSGLAYIIRYMDDLNDGSMPQYTDIECAKGYRLSTNNRMEMMAAIEALGHTLNLIQTNNNFSTVRQIDLHSDSEYLCKAINNKWIEKWQQNGWMTSGYRGQQPMPIKNKDLWEKIITLQNQFRTMNIALTISWLKGHNGDEYNEKCDKLAVDASNKNATNIDEVYESLAMTKK